MRWALGLAAAFIIGALVVYPIARIQSRAPERSRQRTSTVPAGLTLGHLLEMSPAQLADVDIAEMNLLCAKGLPGSENLDAQKELQIVDYWTDRVDLKQVEIVTGSKNILRSTKTRRFIIRWE